ncbi:hypothetical protein EVAR_90841_1 [Eumeta japonica]|uniref:Secreted protein n=1 Tax=Eumeta variegata TaxID=151549 RepID=A0A4C1ZUG1_EUMVA|nr:hypothetical protein EVAR_90841_1 [Eumeta japonica]
MYEIFTSTLIRTLILVADIVATAANGAWRGCRCWRTNRRWLRSECSRCSGCWRSRRWRRIGLSLERTLALRRALALERALARGRRSRRWTPEPNADGGAISTVAI